jgi:hypothetical protein
MKREDPDVRVDLKRNETGIISMMKNEKYSI